MPNDQYEKNNIGEETTVNKINNLNEITLKDTVLLMCSADYKDRFLAEYIQLAIRYYSLRKMIVKYEAGTLEFSPTCDIAILRVQLDNMVNYMKALEVRAKIEKIELPKM